jgi:hypothetical protein
MNPHALALMRTQPLDQHRILPSPALPPAPALHAIICLKYHPVSIQPGKFPTRCFMSLIENLDSENNHFSIH